MISKKLTAIIIAALLPLTAAVAASAKSAVSVSDTLHADISGTRVEIKVSYPFKSSADGIVLWCGGGIGNRFIATVAQRYHDVAATLRGAVLYAGYASVEYICENNVRNHTEAIDDPAAQAELMCQVVARVRKDKRLEGKRVVVFAYDSGCMAAAMLYPKLGSDISKMFMVSPMTDNSLPAIKRMRTALATSESVSYTGDASMKAAVDSMNAASALDAAFSADILGRLMFCCQHVEPLDSIIKSSPASEQADDAIRDYLTAQWQREPSAVHDYWHGQSDAYCSYLSRSVTPGRIRMLQADLPALYGGIRCPVKVVYGADDAGMDAKASVRMMRDALTGKGNTAVDVQALEDYGHDLRRVDRYNRGTVSQLVINDIAEWLKHE